jgi:high affinity Mn2+ porin
VDFQNWSIWAAGAFDYAGDKVGLTYGAVAELNQKAWALRAGYFLIGDKSNSNDFDMQLFKRGGYVTELETRYSLFSQPGKLRVIGWVNEYFAGSYRDAVNLSTATGIDPTTAIIQSRQSQTKYGYVFNIEQTITDNIGVFGRWSWNNGKSEITAFTDIDSPFIRHIYQGKVVGPTRRQDWLCRSSQFNFKGPPRLSRSRRLGRFGRRRATQLSRRESSRNLLRA